MIKSLPDTVACCGLPCDDCPIRDAEVPELASRLGEILSRDSWKKLCGGLSKMETHFLPFQSYEKALAFLGLLEEMECSHTCKEGGGSSDCRIRKCCRDKNIDGCWKCDDFEFCENLNWLHPVNGSAPRENIKYIRNAEAETFPGNSLKWFE